MGAKQHPLPAFPIKVEVSVGGFGKIEFQEWSRTSPLMGRLGGGERRY